MRAALWRAARTLRVSGDRCARQSTVTCRATLLKRRELDHRDMSGPRGAFIVLEGTDRSGKSTQCARLVAALNAAGVSAESWRFPDRTTGIGHMLDAYLRGTPDGDTDDGAVHLLFSANRWEKRRVVRGAWIQVSRHEVFFALCVATPQGGLIAEAPSRHYTCS
jgi:Thymidylate kinase